MTVKITENDITVIENTIDSLCYVLSLIQNLLDCNLKTLKIPEVLFKRDLAIDPEIAYLLFQYSKNYQQCIASYFDCHSIKFRKYSIIYYLKGIIKGILIKE